MRFNQDTDEFVTEDFIFPLKTILSTALEVEDLIEYGVIILVGKDGTPYVSSTHGAEKSLQVAYLGAQFLAEVIKQDNTPVPKNEIN